MEAVHESMEGELINIDGKTLRGAKEAGNKRSLIHMVLRLCQQKKFKLTDPTGCVLKMAQNSNHLPQARYF